MQDRPTVFIVDDDPGVLTALARRLSVDGHLVETFTSAASFLDRLPHDGVACLLLDLLMPELSGLDLQTVMADRGMTMPLLSGMRSSRMAVTSSRVELGSRTVTSKCLSPSHSWLATWPAIAVSM